jgi:hypothetical protein
MIELTLVYHRNTKSPRDHAARFQHLLAPLLGGPLFPGSLNLWSPKKIVLPPPAVALNGAWHLWPVVVEGRAGGVAARRAEGADPKLLEVFSNVEFAPLLNLEPGAAVNIRVRPGAELQLPSL